MNQVKTMDKAALAKLITGDGNGSFWQKILAIFGLGGDKKMMLAEWQFLTNIKNNVHEADKLQKAGHVAITEGKKVMDNVMKAASYFSLNELDDVISEMTIF